MKPIDVSVSRLAARQSSLAHRHQLLEDALVRRLVRQYQVAGVLLDGAYPHVRLGLEADSRIWHGGRLDVQRNTDKANVLLAHGWRVLRFTLFDLTHRVPYVLESVGAQLALACPA